MRSVRALTLATVLLAAVAGCASAGQPVVAGSPPASHASPTVGEAFPQRAAKLASAWVGSPFQQTWEAGYVPLDSTTHLPGDVFHSGADKAAYLAGQFHVTVALPSAPAQQTVQFDSGTKAVRPGLSADQALRTDSLGHCPTPSGCPAWLTVTAARATTERVRTSQGMATVPAWAFRLQGYQGEFVYSAVKPEANLGLAPGQEPSAPPVLPGYQGASLISVSADGRTLTLGTATGCGKQAPTGLVYETKDVVVVGATDTSAPIPSGTVCTADLHMVRLQVHLGDVLGSRTVIDVATDRPEAPQG